MRLLSAIVASLIVVVSSARAAAPPLALDAAPLPPPTSDPAAAPAYVPSPAPAPRAHGPDEPFAHDESPYLLRLDVDIATLIGGGVLWLGTSLIGNTTAPAFCGSTNAPPCDPAQLNALDR